MIDKSYYIYTVTVVETGQAEMFSRSHQRFARCNLYHFVVPCSTRMLGQTTGSVILIHLKQQAIWLRGAMLCPLLPTRKRRTVFWMASREGQLDRSVEQKNSESQNGQWPILQFYDLYFSFFVNASGLSLDRLFFSKMALGGWFLLHCPHLCYDSLCLLP